ncbi:MAG: hypothetical protein AB1Z98_09055 [Nannocystaceae bacterium]
MARIPIILGCAEDHQLPVAAVADALQREGHPVEVSSGIEHDSQGLSASTDRIRGPAVFVLCCSPSLTRATVRRIEGLLSARKGPLHRVMTVEVPARVPTSVVPAILGEAIDAADDQLPPPQEDSGQYLREVVVPTSMAAVPGAIISERASRRRAPVRSPVEEPLGISEEALGLHVPDTAVFDPEEHQGPGQPLPEPEILIATDPSSFDELAAPGGDGVPTVVAEDFPVVGDSSPDVAVAAAPRAHSWEGSGQVEVERVAARGLRDPRAETDHSPLPSSSAPISFADAPDEPEPAPVQRRTTGRVLLLLMAAVGMAGIVTMAVLHDSSGFGGVAPAPVAQRGLPERPRAAAEPEASASATPAVAPHPTDSAEDGAADEAASTSHGAAAEVAASTSGGVEDRGSSGGVAEDDEAATGSDGGGSTTGVGSDAATDSNDDDDGGGGLGKAPSIPPPPDTLPSAVRLEQAIEAALAAGRMQAAGELLVLPAGTETMSWDDAVARCQRRKVEGLRKWKLPSKAQLVSLRRAKLLTSGTYWSSSVVGGDEAHAFDAASGRMNVWLKMEPNGRALCVRKRP